MRRRRRPRRAAHQAGLLRDEFVAAHMAAALGAVGVFQRADFSLYLEEFVREAALRNRPWEHATGPKTVEGKARAAQNGTARQLGPCSVREARAFVAGLEELLRQMRANVLVSGR